MKPKQVKVQRWSEGKRANETVIRRMFADEGLYPYRWSNGPGDVYAPHTHSYHKVIVVVRGSITFGLPELREQVTLHAGDRLDLPAGVLHNAYVGPQGVACLEGHHR